MVRPLAYVWVAAAALSGCTWWTLAPPRGGDAGAPDALGDALATDGRAGDAPDGGPCAADDPLDDDGADANCDGAEGVAARSIYVSVVGDDANPGTPDRPLATLRAAADLAVADRTRRTVFLAAVGVPYPTDGLADLLALGCRVVGGLAPAQRWSRPMGGATLASATTLAAPSSGVWVTGGADAGLSFVRLTAAAAVATTAPDSIALILENTTGFALDRVELVAGNGVAGAHGAAGANATVAGATGRAPTFSGGCNASPTSCSGGLPVTGVICPGAQPQPLGGTGGFGSTGGSGFGQRGESGGAPDDSPGGDGGSPTGGSTAPFMQNLGRAGATGRPGTGGRAVAVTATFEPGRGVVRPPAGAGAYGRAGSGGGGAALFQMSGGYLVCGASGSNGGCGGAGGAGGAHGGLSVGLVVVGTLPARMARVAITRAVAGDGGNGGGGGAGAMGGPSGPAGTCMLSSARINSATGGAGGAGGVGGGGAGGNGGISAGVLLFGGPTQIPADAMVSFAAAPGADQLAGGGMAGSPNGEAGNAGASADVLSY